jgi:hypothetical protein
VVGICEDDDDDAEDAEDMELILDAMLLEDELTAEVLVEADPGAAQTTPCSKVAAHTPLFDVFAPMVPFK